MTVADAPNPAISVSADTLATQPEQLNGWRLTPGQSAAGDLSVDDFRIQNQLASCSIGACYQGIDLRTGERIEIRRLKTSQLSSRLKIQIARCIKLQQLQKHPCLRSIRLITKDPELTILVVDDFGDRTFQEWLLTQKPTGMQLLDVLIRIGTAIAAAHRFGVFHGNLSVQSIGWEDRTERPRLDFSGVDIERRIPAESASPKSAGVSAESAEIGEPDSATDVVDFARILQELLKYETFVSDLRQLSVPQTTRLRKLTNQLTSSTSTDLPELNDLLQTLQSLFLASLNNGSQAEVDASSTDERTEEMSLIWSDVSHMSAMFSELPESRDAGSATDAAIPGVRSVRELQSGSRVGRFQIERKLGEGGMGTVFRVRDIADSSVAAIKVLSPTADTRPNALRQFRREARLLASIGNPWITNLIEVNEDNGLWYIVLEYVDGVDLKTILAERGSLPEHLALAIVADVARGLMDAHQRDIVHRDIKPENILLEGYSSESGWLSETPRVRLADFGIARHLEQSESMAMTQAGGLLGTPLYMSPEQFRDPAGISPQSDIYSLGVTLFELLTGRTPFAADDPMTLAGKHCFEAPPSVLRFNSAISDATDRIVQRCLVKQVGERFADAAQLLREIDHQLRGQPSAVTLHPVLPGTAGRRIVSSRMTWDLRSAPEELWPFVVNTDRLNRAIGLPAVRYSSSVHPRTGVHRFGTIHLAGMELTWEEHPFEWIEGRRMSVLRQFSNGPFESFVSAVELERQSDGSTRLHHDIRIAPRHWLGRQLAKVESGEKCRRSLGKVYTRIDQTLQERQNGRLQSDPFELPQQLNRHQRQRIADRTEQLTARGITPDLTAAIAQFLTTAPPQEVARIRPLELAEQLGFDESQVLDACLLGSAEGLLQLLWDLICPACRVPANTRETLKQLASHGHCAACDQSFTLDAADAVEMIFRVHPDLRESNVGTYCIGGPGHSPHVVAQVRLEPKERLELDLSLSAGDYLIRGPRLPVSIALQIKSSGAPAQLQVLLHGSEGIQPAAVMRSGRQLLLLENRFDVQQLVRIERTIPRASVLTAARAAALPRFRELFPGEVLKAGRLISVQNATFLVTSVPLIDEVYSQLGDAAAFACIEKQAALLRERILLHRGEVIKIIGERVVAGFEHVADAVEAAFELQSSLFTDDLTQELRLSVGVHRGPAIVTTANGRLDYSGLTMRQALALPESADEGIALTEAVFSDPSVHEFLSRTGIRSDIISISLPGKPRQLVQHCRLISLQGPVRKSV